MATIDVRLQEDLKAFLDEEALRSGFASTSVYVEAELIKRIDGPPATELPEGFWDDLKLRVRKSPLRVSGTV